jgi:hypothetical protein
MRWPSCLALGAALLLPAGCSGTLYLTTTGTSPRPPAEVFDCVRAQIPVLGFTQTSFDVDEHRVTAKKFDGGARDADTRFRRRVERLSIELASATDGGARLKISAHTFTELMTQRGPTEVEESASPAVRAAAQKLLEACGS